MGLGRAKVDQQAIAEVWRNMAVKVLHDLGTGRLIGPDYGAQVFGIELAGEDSRIHQVTKQDTDLAPFGLKALGVGEKHAPLRGASLGASTRCAGWEGVLLGADVRSDGPVQTSSRLSSLTWG